MLLELTNQEVMMLQLCVEYRQRDFILHKEMYQKMYGEHYNQRMSEMSDMIKKLEEVV